MEQHRGKSLNWNAVSRDLCWNWDGTRIPTSPILGKTIEDKAQEQEAVSHIEVEMMAEGLGWHCCIYWHGFLERHIIITGNIVSRDSED